MIDPIQLAKLEALILDMDRRITFLEQRCNEHSGESHSPVITA